MSIFALIKTERRNNMAIKRNETEEPQWQEWDYAKINKKNLFADEFWKQTVEWRVLLKHVRKTENACRLLDEYVYPSRLYLAYTDILEANLYVLDDLFYFLTGLRVGNRHNPLSLIPNLYALRFWNLDCYKEMDQIAEALDRIKKHLMACLKERPLWEIAAGVMAKSRHAAELKTINREALDFYMCKDRAYEYAYAAYWEPDIDKEALVDQIVNILNILENYQEIFIHFDKTIEITQFEKLLTMFCESKKGQSLIEPWTCEFGGTRDALMTRMEKDPELGPWVSRCTHLRKNKDVIAQLFCDDIGFFERTEESCNTDNWIRILTIAAILRAYEAQHADAASMMDYETLVLKLTPYFRDEDTVKRFLAAIKNEENTGIITHVANYYNNHRLCTNVSIDLWRVLHKAGKYTAGSKNWYAQIGSKIK